MEAEACTYCAGSPAHAKRLSPSYPQIVPPVDNPVTRTNEKLRRANVELRLLNVEVGPGSVELAGYAREVRAVWTRVRTPQRRARSSRVKVGRWMSAWGALPPGQVPRRAKAPWMCSRYQPKSSPPEDCSVVATAPSPNAASTPARIRAVESASETTGGTPRR